MFARVSMDDGIEANVSTFAAEMRETAFILKNATEGSMVIMDELGRGTCTRDGLAIAIAVCEAMIQKRALVWFATHFRELGAVLAQKAGVITLHMQVEMREEQNITSMLYKIANGAATEKHYGINLARIIGLPPDIITRASEVSNTIAQNAEQRKVSSKGYIQSQRQKLVLKLVEHLQQARSSSMTDLALKKWLKRLQQDFVEKMSELKEVEEESSADEDDESETTINVTTTTTTTGGTTTTTTTGDENSGLGGNSFIDIDMSRETTPILMPSEEEEEDSVDNGGKNASTKSESYRSGITNSHSMHSSVSGTTGKIAPEIGVINSAESLTSATYPSSMELDDIDELSDVEDQI
ncbi:hypothetical protein AA313_de0210304 [Arthrobotrys entomopaga]|nr:hypothetical protein AA313_de0210304 [Arthrobotrys entomopaga]